MLAHLDALTRFGPAMPGLPGLSAPPRHGWANAPDVADLAAFADFGRDRYAITVVPTVDIAAASPAALCRKRSCSFAEWFAFTASSTARSHVDAAGLLRTSTTADQPRFDWANGRRQLALNGPSANLLLRSSEFGTSPWSANGSLTVTADAGTAPDGSATADLVADTSAADLTGAQQSCAITSSANPYTASCFLKAGTSSVASLRLAIGSVTPGEVVVNLATGEAQWRSAFAGTAFSIRAYGNGWYRVAVTCTDNASGSTSLNLILRPAFAASYGTSAGAVATGSVLAWGAQIEQAAFASPYMPTVAASVSRAAETCRLSPALEAILQRSAASVVVRGGLSLATGTGRILGTVTSSGLICGAASSGQIEARDAANSRQLAATLGAGSKLAFGAAHGFDGSGQSLVGNGGSVASDLYAPDARTTVYLGSCASGIHADGRYDFVGIAPSRLADARLAALAAPA